MGNGRARGEQPESTDIWPQEVLDTKSLRAGSQVKSEPERLVESQACNRGIKPSLGKSLVIKYMARPGWWDSKF